MDAPGVGSVSVRSTTWSGETAKLTALLRAASVAFSGTKRFVCSEGVWEVNDLIGERKLPGEVRASRVCDRDLRTGKRKLVGESRVPRVGDRELRSATVLRMRTGERKLAGVSRATRVGDLHVEAWLVDFFLVEADILPELFLSLGGGEGPRDEERERSVLSFISLLRCEESL